MLRSTNKTLKSLPFLIIALLLIGGLTACSDSGQAIPGPVSSGLPNRTVSVSVSQAAPATSAAVVPTPSLAPTPAIHSALGLKLESSTPPTAGHLSRVAVMALSPNDKLLATGSLDQTVRLWETTTFENREVAILKGHYSDISFIVFSPDSKLVATGSYDFTVRLWEVATGRQLAVLQGHSGGVHALAFSPDGQLLASGSGDKTIKLWHVPDGKLITTLTGHGDKVNSVAFSPDGQLLASGSGDWQVKLWEVTSHQELATLKGHSSWVQTVVFSPDGQTLASISGDKTIKLWSVAAPDASVPPIALPLVARLTISYHDTLPGSLISQERPLQFSPDGQTLTALTPYGLQRWTTSGGQLLDSTTLADQGAYVALNRDGLRFATSQNYQPPVAVKLWQVTGETSGLSSTLLAIYDKSSSVIAAVKSVAYSPDGQFYATGGQEYSANTFNYRMVVGIWRASDNSLLNTIQGEYSAYKGLAFSPAGTTLAGLGYPPPPTQPPDNSYTGDLKVWEVPGGKLGVSLTTHSNSPNALAFRPDGKVIAVAGGSREGVDNVGVWELSSGKNLATLSNNTQIIRSSPNSVAYSPDGRLLAAGTSQLSFPDGSYNNLYGNASFGSIELWDATNNYKPIISLPSAATPVLAVSFSPDGKWLVSGGGDGTIKFWQVDPGNPPIHLAASLTGHSAGVKRVVFSPDSKLLATAGSDHIIKLWDVTRQSLIFSTDPVESYGVNDIAFSSDGKTLLSGHSDGSVKHWQLASTG